MTEFKISLKLALNLKIKINKMVTVMLLGPIVNKHILEKIFVKKDLNPCPCLYVSKQPIHSGI